MNAKCLRCSTRTALPRTASVLQLCQSCCNVTFPGADVKAYEALRSRYGYTLASEMA